MRFVLFLRRVLFESARNVRDFKKMRILMKEVFAENVRGATSGKQMIQDRK